MSVDIEAFTATTRNHELSQSLETGGKIKARDLKRNEARKNKFLSEVITVVMTDDYGKIIPGCKFKFVRKKFNVKTLRMSLKRCPNPDVVIDYFCDNNGTAIWMEDMLLRALPDPAYYIIVPRMKRLAVDIRQDPTYEGQTAFIVKDVPLKCKDGVTIVDMGTLKQWFLFAINEEDPNLKGFKAAIEEAKEFIAGIDKKIKNVSKMVFRDADGAVMNSKKAEEEREILYKAFSEERGLGEKQLKNKTEALRRFTDWRSTMTIEFTSAGLDVNTETMSWFVKFSGLKDAKDMEELLLKKDDWSGIKVACGSTDPPLPPWVGRGQLPGGPDALHGDYSELQVNVAGAKFVRVPHGVGTVQKLDRQSASIAAERFELFYGNWETGEKMGHGIDINDAGVYSGRYVGGLRDGHGRWDLCDGTTVIGNFGHSQQFSDSRDSEFKNPYRSGQPHGEVEINFGDGGFYRGTMNNGRVCGYGEYQSGFGEVKVGNFLNGSLHGSNGMHINYSGETYTGTWDTGELNGEGAYSNKRGDSYRGHFDHNFRHGRGTAVFANRGVYRGYYCNNLFSGKGELFFGKRPKAKKQKAAASVLDTPAAATTTTGEAEKQAKTKPKMEGAVKPEDTDSYNLFTSQYKKCYMGYFLANGILNGGAVMDTVAQIPRCVSRMDKLGTLPIQAFIRNISKTNKRIKRKLEKFTDMENHVRADIVKKKKHIFNQQRHYTKKSMYASDMYGIRKDEFEGRQRVRVDRLARTDMDKVIPKKALVPRIKLSVSDEPVHHLQDIFNHIKPDPEHGNVRSVNKLIAKVALSDFEEACERQRLIIYDAIWEKAETAFIQNKRSSSE